jgi:hypothetical protein
MIAKPFRRQGIGQRVVAAVERAIQKDAQVTTILSGVQVNNPHAIQFWQQQGYRIVSAPELLPDQTIAVHLRKDLLPRNVAADEGGANDPTMECFGKISLTGS